MKRQITSFLLMIFVVSAFAQVQYPDQATMLKKQQIREQKMQQMEEQRPQVLLSKTPKGVESIELNNSQYYNPGEAQVLSWDNGDVSFSIGVTQNLNVDIAIRFEPGDLTEVENHYLTAIQFFPFDQMDMRLKVWQGPIGNVVEIYSQDVNGFSINELNTIELNSAVAIDITQDLWIGYNALVEAGFFPFGVDSGPAVGFKGDMLRIQGEAWTSLSVDYFIDNNWIVRGLAEIIADDQAPAKPNNLKATTTPQGLLSATLNWTNPTQTFGGDPLTELDAITIKRNNQVIETVTNPQIGAAASFEDNTISESGFYAYKVYGTNSFGDGAFSSITAYIGEDIPVAPSNATLSVEGNAGFISWVAPAEGINGGYVNPSTIAYTIQRFPDGAFVAQNISETSFVDLLIPNPGTYFYQISASNSQGVGGTAITNVAVLGAEGFLMFEPFNYPNGQLPPGWTITGAQAAWSVSATNYAAGVPNELQLNWVPDATGLSRLVSYPISTGDQDFYLFRFKQRFDSFYGALQDEKIAIDISFDGGDSWTSLWESGVQQDIPAGEFQLPVSVPAGVQTMQLGFRFEGNTYNIDGWWLDDMVIEPVLENDLAGLTIQGPQTISVGIPATYVVKIQNNGSVTQDNYTVKLMKNGNEELVSVPGNSIAAAEIQTYEIEWTPSASDVGNASINGLVSLANDGLAANNSTNNLTTVVFEQGIIPVSIADVSNYSFSNPYDMFWEHSLTQTIYYPEEIGLSGGAIFAINYTNSFASEANNKPIKIWMGETTQNELSNGWVDPASLKLVFDGNIDFPTGQNQILINLDAPYFYSGNNLVVYSMKTDDSWASNRNFINSYDSSRIRTLKAVRDFTPFDPASPPISANGFYLYPDVTLYFNLSGLASLQGVVSDGTDPLTDVKVSLNNTIQTAITDANGVYNFPAVFAGTYTVQFEKFGYETLSIPDVVLAEDQTLELNAQLNAIPQYTLSGIVAGNDGNLIEGAAIRLNGYDNYEVLSDANGVFFFDAVFASNYAISISAFGYTSFVSENIVVSNNTDLGTILLEEQIEAPFNLMVMKDGLEPGQTLFSWNNPLIGWTESFESGALPTDWTQIVTNTGSNAGLPATWTITGPVSIYNTTISPQDGNYQVFMMWDFQEQDEWLITREFTVPAGNLQFWYYGYNGSTFGDNYYVKISTDNGQSWDILWNASNLPFGQNFYQEAVSIDLNMYAGQKAIIAWHNEDGPSDFGMWYYWAIDNISIGDAAVNLTDLMTLSNPESTEINAARPLIVPAASNLAFNARDLNGFNIYLDGILVAEAVTETQFLFSGLADGAYTAGVQAVFTTGLSEIATIDFVVDDTRLLALVANPAGSGTLLGASWYQPDTEVLVKATAEEGFAFVNWTTADGDLISDQPTFFFTMPDQDVILIANFEAFQTFNLTFNIDMTGNEAFVADINMVNITGSMHGWNVLGKMARDQALMRIENSMNYTITMKLPAGEYSYAYFTDEGEDDTDWEDIPSRSITLNEDKVIYDSWGLILGLNQASETPVTIAPNPFSDRIELSNAEWVQYIEISNVLGNKIKAIQYTGTAINTSDLLPGIYVIRLLGDNGALSVRKMIKQ